MYVLLWAVSLTALFLAFVLGLGVALSLISYWGLGAVIFCLVVLACTSTILDKNYPEY